MRVRVDGQLVFNRMSPMLNAARAGFGLAYLLDDIAGNINNSLAVPVARALRWSR
jgi:hypothetical protein